MNRRRRPRSTDRDRSARLRLLSALVCLSAFLSPPANAKDCAPDLAPGRTIESPNYVLVYRFDPGAISIGRHFSVEFAICPIPGKQLPDEVRVDAHMPAHRHGMNYKARVSALPDARFRAEGMLFHMPGRWELLFDLRVEGRTERLAQEVVVQ